ncbi:MAG: response regulator transcription factor [Anaerolineaceae bacterium]|nr:response regulator transcription factor [Anaerolineaceae bacterium]
MTKTILMVDDKANMRSMVRDYLSEENFRVLEAENGQQALAVARQEKPDLILLDIMMPKMDGYEFLQAFRKEQNTPIILLTARLEETDKVLGLELGADDYVTKPFGLRELEARIKAVLRRTEAAPSAEEVLQIGEVSLNKVSHEVRVSGRPVELTPSEFDLLAIFMGAPGRAFSRVELLEKLQGTSFEGIARTIDYHVRNLRTKIEVDPAQPRYVETVFGVGYRFHRYS